MKFSIVVTCYNYDRYVAGAIESALAQTHPDTEVIVVDDGSTDNSPQVIRLYEERVRSIRQSNQGHIAALNAGYAQSTGELVLFLDADDLISPTAASECVAAWQPGAAKVQFDLAIINGAGEDLGRRFCNFPESYDAGAARLEFERYGTYRWPVTAGNAYARSYLDEMLPLTVKLAPDGYLNTVAPVYGDVVTIAHCLGSYRLHGSNLWSSNGRDAERLPERIAQRLDEFSAMAEHAKRAGVPLPDGNPLDHELPFITYRMMALSIGQTYAGSAGDARHTLWSAGFAFLRRNGLPLHLKLAHATWLTALAVAPARVARWLIRLRIDRARFVQPLRRAMARRVVAADSSVASH